jgi:signal transduction histidine kinase
MSQVIRNLVSNALKFTPLGGNVTMRAYFIKNIEDGDEVDSLDKGGRGVVPPNKSLFRYVN